MSRYKSNRIAIISCWYGDYPWYFPYFIHSCSYNPTVDFYIVTDNQEQIHNKPENVIIKYMTLGEMVKTSSAKLGLNVNVNYPYKLCDFKPAYGFLFPEIINGYDFWGHGDIDVVYGNIREFMNDEVLKDHDVISSRHDYITGSFCLFRNKDYINTLFTESRDYKKVFTCPDHFCFDECGFLWKELEAGASIFDYPGHIQSMTYIVKKAERERKLKAYFDFIVVEGNPGKIKWSNGRVIYRNKFEALLYHLVQFKQVCQNPTILNPFPDTYYFTPKKIVVNYKN